MPTIPAWHFLRYRVEYLGPVFSGDRMMSLENELFLALIVAAFVSFIVVFAMLSWFDDKYEERIAPVAEKKVRSRVGSFTSSAGI